MAGTAVLCSLIEELTSTVAQYLFEEVSLVSNFQDDFDSLCGELECIKSLLKDCGGKRDSSSVCNWLENLEDFLEDSVHIVEECRAAGNIYNPILRSKMGRKIKKLNERITKIKSNAKYIKYAGSLLDVNARLGSNSQDKRERWNTSVHPVGMDNDIQKITDLILKEDGPPVIAVVGMGGQGKTLLVQSVFNSQMVQQHFERRFWVDVNSDDQTGPQKRLEDLSPSKIENQFADSEGKLCLFVFDDVWNDALCTKMHRQSVLPIKRKHKIVITTRHKKIEGDLGYPPHIHNLNGLSEEDSWKLFSIHAFPDLPDHRVPDGLTEDNCKPICKACGGLPLAIKTVGAYMAKENRRPQEWQDSLSRLNNLEGMRDKVIPSLRLSYEVLPDNLKFSFLYFSVFPKGVEIKCENLVHMWIAQGLLFSQVGSAEDAYAAGRLYIEELVDRCLIQVSRVGRDERVERCKIHDLLHHLAVSESTKCLLKPGVQLDNLPVEECRSGDLRRISLIKNSISSIDQAIWCPRLRILLLSENFSLASISESFFNNLTCLRVLDLSYTAIRSLPKSIGKLKRLKFLNLSGTNISKLPEWLSGLERLQFLDVSHCSNLSKLHSGIGKHKFMQYLNVESCGKLEWLPLGISELGHLQTFKASLSDSRADAKGKQYALRVISHRPIISPSHRTVRILLSQSKAFHLKDLKGLATNLQHLELGVGVESEGTIQFEEGTFLEMTKMRTLSFENNSGTPCLDLPNEMGVMKCLETVHLVKCAVPDWIFGLGNIMELVLDGDNSKGNAYKGLERIRNLKKLHLLHNEQCEEFPEEFGEYNMAFPKLEELIIHKFEGLERFPRLHKIAMPMLKYFRLRWCNKLTNMVEGIENLKSLEEVEFLIDGDPPHPEDLLRGSWRRLKARKIKIIVSPQYQRTIDEMDGNCCGT